MIPHDSRSPHRNQRFVHSVPDSGETLVPYGVFEITDASSDTDGGTQLTLALPTEDGQQRVAICGPSVHVCTQDFPAYATYESSDGTPAAGEEWGVVIGSHLLRKGQSGFIILGDADGFTVRVMRSSANGFYIGKVINADIASEDYGTVEQHEEFWSATGVTFSVYNPHDVVLKEGLKVRWGKYPGWNDWIVEPWHFTEC